MGKPAIRNDGISFAGRCFPIDPRVIGANSSGCGIERTGEEEEDEKKDV
jgi:hypothetical protein